MACTNRSPNTQMDGPCSHRANFDPRFERFATVEFNSSVQLSVPLWARRVNGNLALFLLELDIHTGNGGICSIAECDTLLPFALWNAEAVFYSRFNRRCLAKYNGVREWGTLRMKLYRAT